MDNTKYQFQEIFDIRPTKFFLFIKMSEKYQNYRSYAACGAWFLIVDSVRSEILYIPARNVSTFLISKYELQAQVNVRSNKNPLSFRSIADECLIQRRIIQ